ncbi:MAG: hypothetical protein JST92_07115 [Deltaproteobacteria bacterium]|nr:hypothetical protein [Deltaproteobacteria bacterium]
MRLTLFALAAALALTGCKPSLIAGTKIPDTKDTRAALEVLSKYKDAVEALNADGVVALAAPSYFDKGDPSKGVSSRDYAGLKAGLAEDFKHLKTVKIDATIKDVRVDGDTALIDYYLVMHYMLVVPSTNKFPWKDDQDDAQLRLVRVNGEWKVQSGL